MSQEDLNKIMARIEQFVTDLQKRLKGDLSTIRDLKVLVKALDAEEFNESDLCNNTCKYDICRCKPYHTFRNRYFRWF